MRDNESVRLICALPHEPAVRMAPLRKSLTLALVLAIALSAFVVIPRPVAATQNHPTWTQGDFWVYTQIAGSASQTIRIDVYERTTLTLALGTYSVWHITTTTTNANGDSGVVPNRGQELKLRISEATTS